MSRRLWALVLVIVAAVGLACKTQGSPTDFCVVNADNPHLSSVELAKGNLTITGKGWFKCTQSPREITLYVVLEWRTTGAWATMDQRSLTFTHPPAGKKSKDVVTATPCDDGRFRTRARASGVDNVGNDVQQTGWSLSGEVVDPCKKGKT